jgi:hypothetical protein
MNISSVTSASNYYSQAAQSGPVSVGVAMAALKVNPRLKVSISDTTQNISRYLTSITALGNNITGITQTDPSVHISLTAAQMTKSDALLGKFSTDYKLDVTDAQAGSVPTLTNNSHVTTLTVTDSSTNVASHISDLNNQSKVIRITLNTPGAALSLTATQMASNADALSKVYGNYSLAINDANCADALSYTDNLHVRSVTVVDTASHISSNLDDLKTLGLRIKSVTSSDSDVLSINASQVQSDAIVIGKLYKGYQLSLLNTTMSQAQSLYANKKVVSIQLADTATNVASNIGLLSKLGNSLQSIHVTDASSSTLQMTSAQFNAQSQGIAKISANDAYTFSITGASAAEAKALQSNTHVTAIKVTDTASSVSAALDDLQTNAKVAGIGITGTGLLTVSSGQLTSDAGALGKINSNYKLNVKDVDADAATALMSSNSHINSITVFGTATQLANDVAGLSALGSKITSVTQTNATAIGLTASQWGTYQDVLRKITGGCSVNLSEVSATSAIKLAADPRVQNMSITDTAGAINNQWNNLLALGGQISALHPSDSSPSLTLKVSQWQSSSTLLGRISGDYALSITGVSASQVSDVLVDTHVVSMDVTDTAAHISNQLDTLQTAITDHVNVSFKLHIADPIHPINLIATQLTDDADVLGVIQGNYNLAIANSLAAQATTIAQNSHVSSVGVNDTGAHVIGQLANLNGLGNKLQSITLSDGSSNHSMSLTQWIGNKNIWDKVAGGLHVSVSQVPAAQTSTLLLDSRVSNVSVSDSAAHIAASLDTLQALGTGLASITANDADSVLRLSMAQYTRDATALSKIDSGNALYISGANVNDLTSLNANDQVAQIALNDTSANIAPALASLATNDKIDTITVIGSALPYNLTLDQRTSYASALDKFVGGYKLNITDATASDVATFRNDSHVASISVTDTPANIVSALASLSTTDAKLQSISLSTSPSNLTMTAAQWSQYQTVMAKIANSYTVELTDVTADKVAFLAADARVASVKVADTTAHINNNLNALEQNANLISSTTPSEVVPSAMTVTAQQYFSDVDALADIANGNYSLVVNDVALDQMASLSANNHVTQLNVSDSATNIALRLSDLAANSKLGSIHANDSTVMSLSDENYSTYANTLAKLNISYTTHITEAAVARAATLHSDTKVVDFRIADTSAHIGTSLVTLLNYNDLTGIDITNDDGPITLAQSEFDSLSESDLAKISGDYRFTLTGAQVQDISGNLANANVKLISLSDTAQNLATNFDSVANLGSTIGSITVSDAFTSSIVLSAEQYAYAGNTLAKIDTSYSLAITNSTAQDAATYANLDTVAHISIADTSANISASFEDLVSIGSKLDFVASTDDAPITLTQSQYDAHADFFATVGLDPNNYLIVA